MKKIFSVLLAVLTVAAMFTVASAEQYREETLPAEYKQVEYLESNGTQMIDTGLFPQTNTKAEVVFDVTSSAKVRDDLNGVFGSNRRYGKDNAYVAQIGYKNSTTNYTMRLGPNMVYTAKKLDWQKQTIVLDAVKGEISINGEVVSSTATSNVKVEDANRPHFFMFGVGTASVSSAIDLTSKESDGSKQRVTCCPGYSKIYSVKIWEGSTLVANFIPVVRISDSKTGMYDLVTKKFLTNCLNSGTADAPVYTELVAGPEIQAAPVEPTPSGANDPTPSGANDPTPATGDSLPFAFVGIVIAAAMMTVALVRRKKED